MAEDKIKEAGKAHAAVVSQLVEVEAAAIGRLALQVVDTFHRERRLFLLGNGPHAPLAALVANVFQHRLAFDRPSLPAVALSHDAVLAGSLGRQGAARQYFSRQLRTLAVAGDVVLVFADSHRDEALVEALEAARQIGCTTAAVCSGDPDSLGESPDLVIVLPGDSPPRALEATLFFGNVLCELVEKELFGL